jgi:bisphosphoglycerate-dependent phosphoglycerate mutase
MKTITLLRHAKSSWDNTDLVDFDRPLNARGKKNAPDMAQRLKAAGIRPSLILSSPAKRNLVNRKDHRNQNHLSNRILAARSRFVSRGSQSPDRGSGKSGRGIREHNIGCAQPRADRSGE